MMAITRARSLAKERNQATPVPPLAPILPPPPAATVAEIYSNSNNNEQPLPQQEQHQQQQEQPPGIVSDYEQTREQRIKENRERLQKLGIVDLSLQLKSIVATKRTPRRTTFDRKIPSKSPALNPPESIRRSSRLQNVPTVTYVELKEEKPQRSRDIVLEEGAKPEFYTEEHEKLLGNTEMPWSFFVDGYRADGTRIYDSVAGKTCHQCRQKTLGQRTHCSKCNLVQGQFCGDCLMMRYGEHVVEANQNPNWICPPCRGICNCSLCRQARGWAPTGALYRRINSLGYKSVAHYLFMTKRAPPDSEKNSDALQSAKRALPFEGMEVPDDNGSGNEAVVEKTELTPQSESEVTTVVNLVMSDPKPRGVGRPRKRSKKESTDGSGGKAVVEKIELNPQSESEATTVGKSVPQRRGVGRPRKSSKKESIDAGEESVKKSEVAESKPVPNTSGPKSSTSTVDESNSQPAVRRSGRSSMQENVNFCELSVKEKGTPGEEPEFLMESPYNSESKVDGVASRLRLRGST